MIAGVFLNQPSKWRPKLLNRLYNQINNLWDDAGVPREVSRIQLLGTSLNEVKR